jgi:hypothetical protein
MDTLAWFLLCMVASTYFLLLCSAMAQDWIRFLDGRGATEEAEGQAEEQAKLQIVRDVMNDDLTRKPKTS